MSEKLYTLKQVIHFLNEARGKRSKKQFADSLGVSPQFLCNVLKGRQLPSEKLGFEKVEATWKFRRKNNDLVHS